MDDTPSPEHRVVESYRRRAARYDLTLRLLDSWAWLGFDISGWRKLAIRALDLKPGATVVDIGCGTGLNFALLHREVGPKGRIIGVDLSEAMIAQARNTVQKHGWTNVELMCVDAAQYPFDKRVDGVLSTYALTLVSHPERVVSSATEALVDGGRLVVLDMAWPRRCPLWFRHVLFFLRAYGVTQDVLERRPWEAVQAAMATGLEQVTRRGFWLGFFYLAAGVRRGEAKAVAQ